MAKKGNKLGAVYPGKVDKEYKDNERKYKAEDALRIIERAKEYRRDKSLMGDVKRLANSKLQTLKKIK